MTKKKKTPTTQKIQPNFQGESDRKRIGNQENWVSVSMATSALLQRKFPIPLSEPGASQSKSALRDRESWIWDKKKGNSGMKIISPEARLWVELMSVFH